MSRKTIFIATLGTTRYEKSEYIIDGSPEHTGYFGFVPYALRFGTNSNENRMYCIVTKDVIAPDKARPDDPDHPEWKEYPSRNSTAGPGTSPNNYEYLKAYVLELKNPRTGNPLFSAEKISYVTVDIDASGVELYHHLDAEILSRFSKDDEISIYLDATNSYRGVSITMFTALKMIETFYKNVRIASIAYWRKEEAGFCFTDLIETYHNIQIAENISRFHDTFHLPRLDEKLFDNNTSLIGKLSQDLVKVERALQNVNISDLTVSLHVTIKDLKAILDNNLKVDPVLLPYINELYRTYTALDSYDNDYLAINVAKELKQRGQYQLGITFLEATYNHIIIDALLDRLPNRPSLTANEKYSLAKYAEASLQLRVTKSKKELAEERASRRKRDSLSKEYCSVYDGLAGKISPHTQVNGKPLISIISKFLEMRNGMLHGQGTFNSEKFDRFAEALPVLKQSISVVGQNMLAAAAAAEKQQPERREVCFDKELLSHILGDLTGPESSPSCPEGEADEETCKLAKQLHQECLAADAAGYADIIGSPEKYPALRGMILWYMNGNADFYYKAGQPISQSHLSRLFKLANAKAANNYLFFYRDICRLLETDGISTVLTVGV